MKYNRISRGKHVSSSQSHVMLVDHDTICASFSIIRKSLAAVDVVERHRLLVLIFKEEAFVVSRRLSLHGERLVRG